MRIGIVTSALVIGVGLGACGGGGSDPLEGVDSIVFIKRPARTGGLGDIFQYTSYIPGAQLVKLSPPTADGELTVLCCDNQGPEYADMDIGSYDLSFDARQIVMSARLSGDQAYSLFMVYLTADNAVERVEQLPTNPNKDYVYPAFMPGERIVFMTNDVVEEGAPQFRDEYERGTTTQMGVINIDGSGEVLGPRNLSHRVFPTMMSDGRILFTQWDHLGDMNAGHLVFANQDMTTVREAFGKEGTGITNSYLKAVEVSPGRVVAIGSSRDRTLQSGAILDIRLGEAYEQDGEIRADRNMSESTASFRVLTPQVPLGREPSSQTIGRYYDAYPLDAGEYPQLLVSWADGPVESGTLEAAGLNADFGIYLYDSEKGARRPIYNDPAMWEVFPRPLRARAAPPEIDPSGSNGFSEDAVLVGSMNVYESSIDPDVAAGSIWGVRVLEGFSVEEGIPNDFGLTEHEGAALLGYAQVREDGSWAALIPPNVPVHLQTVDRFGMAITDEPIWISGASGESRFCGGCHEDRTRSTVIQPGITQAVAIGPDDLMSEVGRQQRASTDYSIDNVVGVPWDLALQPIFDANCVDCHDGTPGPANPSYTISDPESGASLTWTFDLTGREVDYGAGDMMISGYSASHLSLMGPDMMELEDAGLVIEGDFKVYVRPVDARGSLLMEKLNPPQLFPQPNTAVRAFDAGQHLAEQGRADLTPDEYHLLILMADAGGQFYARENAPNASY